MWEFDTPAERRLYTAKGCEAVGFGKCETDLDKSLVISAVAEIMGDDLDGMASMLEDAENMGLI